MFACCKAPPPATTMTTTATTEALKTASTTTTQAIKSAGNTAIAGATAAAAAAAEATTTAVNTVTGNTAPKNPLDLTRGDEIKKNRFPTVAVFPSVSRFGLATLKALTSWPHRNACGRIVCVVRTEADITLIHKTLGESTTDSLAFTFADYDNEEAVTAALIGCDRFFLVPFQRGKQGDLAVSACRAAKEAGVAHVILLSVLNADAGASELAKHHLLIEKHVAESNMSHTILRAGYLMNDIIVTNPSLITEGIIYGAWGGAQFAPVAIEDVGRCAAALLSAPLSDKSSYGKTYQLTGPELGTGVKLAQVLSKVVGKKVEYQDVPRENLEKRLIEDAKLDEYIGKGLAEISEGIRFGQAVICSTDVVKLTQGNHTTFERFAQVHRSRLLMNPAPLLAIFPAHGKVGSACLAGLIMDSSNCNIRAIVHSEERRKEIQDLYKDLRLSIVVADMENPDTFPAALEGVDSLAIIPPETIINFNNVDQLIQAAEKSGVLHTVLMSVKENATTMGSKYSAWERVLQKNSASFTIVRAAIFMELVFRLADQIKTPPHTVKHWLSNGKFCPVHAGDVGEVLGAVLRDGALVHHSHSYIITGPRPMTFADMCKDMSEVLGYKVVADPTATMEDFRALLAKRPYAPFNIEEIVKVHETLAQENELAPSPELLRFVGRRAVSFKAFVQKNKNVFTSKE